MDLSKGRILTPGRVPLEEADPMTIARALRSRGSHFGGVLAHELAVFSAVLNTARTILLQAGVREIAMGEEERGPARDDNGDEPGEEEEGD